MVTKVGDMIVTVRADTRPFDRALRHVARRLWWMRYGQIVTAVAAIAGFIAGFVTGFLGT